MSQQIIYFCKTFLMVILYYRLNANKIIFIRIVYTVYYRALSKTECHIRAENLCVYTSGAQPFSQSGKNVGQKVMAG